MNLFAKWLDRRFAAMQQDLVSRHYDEVQNIYQTMRGWRHDYHNHIQTMLALLETQEQTAGTAGNMTSFAEAAKPLKEYLLSLNDDLTQVDTVIKTGNIMIDAILNSKLSLIQKKGIEVSAKAVVPHNLAISEIDLCNILGNLLDNAMEACLRQPPEQKRFVRVYMGILKKQLYISVSNSMGKTAKQGEDRFLSSKQGRLHGLGLGRIDQTVEKYGGYVNRKQEEGVFATELLLPQPVIEEC
ncbi:MAG: sensor histidine kinase [Lachnospiraceae bacterium]|jgi:two-component system sensor histidine kinase AgrC|nr:sensor histidine kinase [Lachnospiraceae bacterium]